MKEIKKFIRCFLLYISLVFCVSEFVFGESKEGDLNNLWDVLIQNNIEIKAAKREKDLASLQLDLFWKNYLPRILLSSSGTFLDMQYDNSGKLSKELYSTITINENLPGGLSINVSPVVTFDNNVDISSLSLSVSQYLNFEGMKEPKNLEKVIKNYNWELLKTYNEILLLSKLESFTECYINLRQVNRNILLVKESLEVLKNNLNCFEELQLQGKVSLNDVFHQEEQIREYENNLQDLIVSKENLMNQICDCLCKDRNSFSEVLFDLEVCQLPGIYKIYDRNPSIEYVEIQKAILKKNLVLEKQKIAPVLSVDGNIPVHNSYKNWSVTAKLDLNGFLDGNYKLVEDEYRSNLENLEDKRQSIEGNIIADKVKYKNLLETAENQLVILEKNFENSKQQLAAGKIIFSTGNISYMDLLQMIISVKTKEYLCKNQLDMIWFYKWMVCNREL